MGYIHKRNIKILQRKGNSKFYDANIEVYSNPSKLLGSSSHAEKILLANHELMGSIMPEVLGVDNRAANWRNLITNYFYSFNLEVPFGGKDLDISLNFDLSDNLKKAAIAELKTAYKVKFDSDKELSEFILTGKHNIEEIDFFKYCTPVNKADYIAYIFCLYHNRVANKQEFVKNSIKIDFYLLSDNDTINAQRESYELDRKINKLLINLEENTSKFEAICTLYNIDKNPNKDATDNLLDMSIKLQVKAKADKSKFIDICNDSDLLTKALISNYINSGILTRLENNSMIVDSLDHSIIIGNDMVDAVKFFKDDKNNAKLSQYKTKYLSLNK